MASEIAGLEKIIADYYTFGGADSGARYVENGLFQKGRGIGSNILGALKKFGGYALKKVAGLAVNTARDVIQGKKLGEALLSNAKDTVVDVVQENTNFRKAQLPKKAAGLRKRKKPQKKENRRKYRKMRGLLV